MLLFHLRPCVEPALSNLFTKKEHIRAVTAASPTLEEAAQTLGINPATLWRERKEYGI